MHLLKPYQYCFFLLAIVSSLVQAETNYVIDELKIGLHQTQTTDSPILALIPSGAAVTVLERDNDLVKVTEQGGKSGWVHSRYLTETQPGKSRIVELENENAQLQQQLALAETRQSVSSPDSNDVSNGALEQQLNTERLKVGELQAQLAEIKAKIPSMESDNEYQEEINQLKQANAALVSQMESAGMEIDSTNDNSASSMSTKTQLIILGTLFVIGMVLGAYLLDFTNRRRHGGFRI